MFSRYLRDLIWLNYCWKLNQVSPVAKVALKITYWISHVKQLNDWLTDWLTNWLTEALGLSRHSKTWNTQGTQETWRALGHWRHSGTWRALWHSRHLGIRALKKHSGTQALGHSGTWALEALEALYLADSTNLMFVEPRKPCRKC